MVIKQEFGYKGYTESFTVPRNGLYLLEAWGAQGGNVSSASWNELYQGGYGAYSSGSIYLEKDTVVYVSVGQRGSVSEGLYTFNGGGCAHQYNSCYTSTASGGGCTHFSLKENTLKDLSNYKDTVLLVAAGGGGAYTRMCNKDSDSGSMSGGHAGGVNGSSPIYIKQGGYSNTVPTGGTQTRGGISSTSWSGTSTDSTTVAYNGFFGQGGIYYTSPAFSGGGGGLYGGASGEWRAGAGGSSYISFLMNSNGKNKKKMVCYNCQTSTEKTEYTISTTHFSHLPIQDYAKTDDGYARITLLNSFYSCNLKVQRHSSTFVYIIFIVLC